MAFTTHELTQEPDGAWTQTTAPKAIYHLGVMYFGFSDGDGVVKVGSWNGTTTTLFSVGTTGIGDNHSAPSILIRASDSRLMVFWSAHDGPAMYMRISTNPLDVTSWGSTVNLDSQLGGADYTYPSVVQLTSEANDPIYLFFRDHPNAVYSKSTNDGATWSALQVLAAPTAGRWCYHVIDSNGTDRIDVGISNGHPINQAPPTTTHHLYWNNGSWRSADGTPLGSPPFAAGSLPLVDAGNGWPHSINVTGPTMGYTVDTIGGTTSYYVATWNGASWDKALLGDSNSLVSDGNAVAMAMADGDTAYATVINGGKHEMYMFTRGSPWAATAVTSNSGTRECLPGIHQGWSSEKRPVAARPVRLLRR